MAPRYVIVTLTFIDICLFIDIFQFRATYRCLLTDILYRPMCVYWVIV